MRVSELIEELRKLPADVPVGAYVADAYEDWQWRPVNTVALNLNGDAQIDFL